MSATKPEPGEPGAPKGGHCELITDQRMPPDEPGLIGWLKFAAWWAGERAPARVDREAGG